MKRKQLTITFPEQKKDCLLESLVQLKDSKQVNLSAFCRKAISEIPCGPPSWPPKPVQDHPKVS